MPKSSSILRDHGVSAKSYQFLMNDLSERRSFEDRRIEETYMNTERGYNYY